MGLINYHVLASSALIVLAACGSSKKSAHSAATLPGTWQSTPVVVDGDNREWPSPYPNYDSKGKIAYTSSNDRRYIYITMQTGDELTEMKILKAGMTVSVDTTSDKNTPFSINYPLANDNVELDIPQNMDGQKEGAVMFEKQLAQRIRKAIEQANQFTLEGFTGCTGGYMISQTVPCGIKVKARINEYKELVWEAAIPVKALYNKDTLTAAEAGKPISICFAIKGFKAPKGKGVENANGGMNQAMGGGGRNAAMGGGGGSAPRGRADNPLEHLYSNTKTWKQCSIVVQP